MKKIITSLTVLLLTVFVVAAADNTNSLFSSKELRLDTFATWSDASDWGYGIGATYYQTKNLGVSVWAGREDFDTEGNLVEQAGASLNLRVPITDVLAPYIAVGTAYDSYEKEFSPVAGLGVEYRVTEKFGLFAEGSYSFYRWDEWEIPDWDEVGVKLGLKLGF